MNTPPRSPHGSHDASDPNAWPPEGTSGREDGDALIWLRMVTNGVGRVANGEHATTAAPHIADNGDGVDWTHLRRDMEHRLVTFTRPDSLNDWRAGKLAGLGHNLHDGGDTP